MPGTTMTTARTAGRSIYKEKIIDVLLGVPVFFLLTQPFIFDMHILGPAYFCTLLTVRLRRSSGMAGAILGIILLPNAQLRWKYGLIFLLLLMIDAVWRKWIRENQPVLRGICLAATLPMSVLCLWMIRRIDAYHFVMTLLEAVLFYGYIRLYDRGIRILENQRYNAWGGLSEHLLETSCVIGTFLAAISGWSFWNLVPWQVLHMLLISMVAYRCGMGAGAIYTLITIVILRLSGCCLEAYGLLCMIIAMVSGYFRDMGRLGLSLAVVCTGIIYLVLFMMKSRPYDIFITLLLSQGVFYFIPEHWYPMVKSKAPSSDIPKEDSYKEQQLQRMEAALLYTAEAIRPRPVQCRLSEKDMAYLCSDIAGRMCEKCEHHTKCWGNEFHATYRVIGQVMQATQKKGKICRSDISGDFLERCPQSDEFVRLVNRYFEIYRLNLSWENRLEKNMRLASMQLTGIAGQLFNLRSQGTAASELERVLLRKLTGWGYRVTGMWIEKDKERVRGLRIRLNQERTGRNVKQIEELLADVFEYEMVVTGCHSCGHREWEWELREKLTFTVMTGVVSNGREPVNGDCYIRDRLGYDQYLLALSDGMGTGSGARKESELALKLLEKLLNAGYTEEEAVSQLNLVLLLHNREEVYTTLDLGLLHLGTGALTLVKAGGAVSLIKSQGKVEILQAGTLPIGILDDIDPSIYHRELAAGDVILMMSDGIMDQVPDIRQAEHRIRKTLRDIPDTASPQQIAEIVYETIMEAYGGCIEDDVTILAARLVPES